MRLAFASIITLATLAIGTSARPGKHHGKHHHGHHGQHQKGKGFEHILQIWFENQDFDVVNKVSSFTNLAKQGILLDNYNALQHPSLPNYIDVAGGSNFGITNDDYYNIPQNISTLYDLLEKKGLTWKVYQEDIPSVGYTGFKSGEYVRKHNPAVVFDSVAFNKKRLENIVPGTQLDVDIKNDDLPNWMFFTPNMLNDGHDTNATYAGKWLENFYKKTLSNPKFLEKTLILVTFDENSTYSIRNKVWSLLFGAIPKHLQGTTDSTYYTHFSALNTVEKNWNLGSLGRGDAEKQSSNVFSFLAKDLGYTNVDVPESEIPMNNGYRPGLLTGKSWNQTHPNGGTPPPK
ncbi:phosphoesterase family-domain-containing protein [Cunninghamella echinulata]|nr:phosphoesterase family-domain-containing protein [Cunninghamella echinulata]